MWTRTGRTYTGRTAAGRAGLFNPEELRSSLFHCSPTDLHFGKNVTCFRPLIHPAPIQVRQSLRSLSVPVAEHDWTYGWIRPK